MAYIVQSKDGIRHLASGKHWSYGQPIGPGDVPRHLWDRFVSEGVVVETEAIPEPESRFNDLLLLEGMTPERKQALGDLGIDTVEQLANAPDTVLIQLKGVGPATIKRWKEAVT